MNTRRELLLLLGASALAAPFGANAQQPLRIPRVAILGSELSTDPWERERVVAIRDGLRQFGYEDGRNVLVQPRWADGKYERLPVLASEIVREKPDVIVAFGIKAAVAAKNATFTIPIVLPGTSSDLIAMGLIASYAKPGGNLTGSTAFGPELIAKRLEMLKESVPRATRFAVLVNPANPSSMPLLESAQEGARTLRVQLKSFAIKTATDLPGVFAAIARERMEGMIYAEDTMFVSHRKAIADLSLKYRIPTVGGAAFARDGGLAGYSVDTLAMYRAAAMFIDKILKGARAGDLPIDRAMRFEMIVNLKVARMLGITPPQTVLVQATKVIE